MQKISKIYVLSLADGCWYVGKTTDIASRLSRHLRGVGCKWTQVHPIQELVSLHEGDSEEEMRTTLDYMKLYGFDKVRGGAYTRVHYPVFYPTPALDAHTLRKGVDTL